MLRGPQGQYRRVRKISPLPGFEHRTVQLLAIRFTWYAILANYSVETGDISPAEERLEPEALLKLCSAEGKNEWTYTSTASYDFMERRKINLCSSHQLSAQPGHA
jgi:hypothetical protein